MGRYLEQTESRSELQQRIAAELRAKAAERAKQESGGDGGYYDAPDGVNDAEYLKGTKTTTTLAPIWAVIFIAGLGVLIYFIYMVSRG